MPSGAPESPTNQDPFVIRGHHLTHFAIFLQYGLTPADMAKLKERQLQHDWVEANALGDREWVDYTEDVVGSSCSQLTNYRVESERMLSEFLTADRWRPLEVVTARPDTMCRTATVGRHCVQRFSALFYQDYLRRDGDKVLTFIDCAKKMGFGGLLETFQYTAEFSDNPPLELTGLRTVMQVGRQVLNNPAFRELWPNKNTAMAQKLKRIPDAESTIID